MRIELDKNGNLPANCPKQFFRVEDWKSGRRLADFTTKGEAERFSYASNLGTRNDGRVSTMSFTGR